MLEENVKKEDEFDKVVDATAEFLKAVNPHAKKMINKIKKATKKSDKNQTN